MRGGCRSRWARVARPGTGLPFVESTGQTVINLGAQFALPFKTRARWDVVGGKFIDISDEDVPSIGLQGQIMATDLMGVVGQDLRLDQ